MPRALEKYYTRPDAVRHLLDRLPELRGDVLFDPTSGDGRMAQALVQAGRARMAYLNDIDEAAPGCTHLSALDPRLWELYQGIDLVVTNPPFSIAGEIAARALAKARVAVALLVRVTWLEACGPSPRAPGGERRWLARQPPSDLIVLPRSSFTGNGSTDSATCAWAVWRRDVRSTIHIIGRGADPAQPCLPLGVTPG
jgi:hypothetical protein